MLRKIIIYVNIIVRRRIWFRLVLLIMILVAFASLKWLAESTARALKTPPPPEQNLQHFRRNRNMGYYLNNTQLLIEPSIVHCSTEFEVPVIVLVASAPLNFERRKAIRLTWGKYQPTYFMLGVKGTEIDDQLVYTYMEGKEYSDIIVFDLLDHYQNLTLKTALMMQWTLTRCPQAQFMFKTDDDVLVNPWTLVRVLKDHRGAKLIGYRIHNTPLHRDEYNKWYIPRWVCPNDVIPQYLSGTGYLISGNYIEIILKAAHDVPLVNLEDVYFTYLVANRMLKLDLTHDRRLSPYKPWVPFGCAYWGLASLHSLGPTEIAAGWSKIYQISKNYKHDGDTCHFLSKYLSNDIFLY